MILIKRLVMFLVVFFFFEMEKVVFGKVVFLFWSYFVQFKESLVVSQCFWVGFMFFRYFFSVLVLFKGFFVVFLGFLGMFKGFLEFEIFEMGSVLCFKV